MVNKEWNSGFSEYSELAEILAQPVRASKEQGIHATGFGSVDV
jgi:hypothetical protein